MTARQRTRASAMVPLMLAAAMLLALLPGSAANGQSTPDPQDWSNFAKVELTSEVGEPMSMAVLPDGRVLHTNRHGQFRLYDPLTASTRVISSLPVYQFSEDGMQGIALDPDYEDTGWLYVYYSPVIPGFPDGPAPEGSPGTDPSIYDEWQGYNNLSRFQFVDDPGNPYVDLASEEVILQVPINRGLCCHNGGDIGFDSQGNLYLSTGDDTNPFQSNNYTPIDERPWRNPGFDAQRTSGNTADLRGKILRLTPLDEPGDVPGLGSTYTVPDDNMFNSGAYNHLFPGGEYDPDLALPEIYAMGFRNPFRFSVDPVTDILYVGDYGPDAGQANPLRGPRATVEWVILDGPRNHGWPYCVGNHFPYIDFDFETGESFEAFDCEGGPINDSHRNTGLTQLPPVTPAEVWYHNSTVVPEFPELGSGGGGPMGGPVYRYHEDLDSPVKFPEFYDGIAFFYEWTRNYIKQFDLSDDGTQLEQIRDFLPTAPFNRPMDMEFGPDGSLYLLEYGGGFFVEHALARLSQVIWVPDGRPPVVRVAASPTSGQPPLEVSFSSDGTHSPEGDDIVSYEWAFGDGATSSEPNPTHTYTQRGRHVATLLVTDSEGRTGRAGVTITVGNTAPDVDIRWPVDGGFFDWGDDIGYRVVVRDREDGDVDCDAVSLSTALGHDQHAHPMDAFSGCEGTFSTPANTGHGAIDNLWWGFSARYTDQGAGDVPSLTGESQSQLNPKRRQAQHRTSGEGVSTQNANDPAEGGGQRLTNINHGNWVAFDPVNLLNIDAIRFRVASAGPGGNIELRRDAPDGDLIATAAVPNTGGNNNYTDVIVDIDDPGGTFALHFVFTNPDASPTQNLFVFNFFEVQGEGVTGPPPVPECDGTIVVGGRDSGVADRVTDDLWCASELLDDGRLWRNHGRLVSHVDAASQALVADGVLTPQERAQIMRTVARSSG